MNNTDVDFPRGGSKPNSKHVSENLFSSFNEKKKPKSRKTKRQREKDNASKEKIDFVPTMDMLNTMKIQEGMMLLTCVRNVTAHLIRVELPDRNFGDIQITSVSQQYNSQLENVLKENEISEEDCLAKLNKMFKPGQFLPAVVVPKVVENTSTRIELSIDPKDININFKYNTFYKYMLMWAAVESCLEHGYSLNAGIKNCRIFLPNENVEKEETFCVGIPIWCVIIKCEVTGVASTLVVSALKKHIEMATANEETSLHHIIPGMQVDFGIEQVLKNGLQGKILNDNTAYVNELYYQKTLSISKTCKEGALVKARVLYVQPQTKVIYLTLKSLDTVPQPSITTGHITNAQIVSKCYNGLYLKLNKREVGFVTNKRILQGLQIADNIKRNLSDVIKKKYPIGSTHQCRILNYNYMSDIYTCTLEKKILQEKLFTSNDVQIGQKIEVQIKEINKSGLAVKFGHLNGFITNLHLSNSLYTDNIKTKFAIGQKHMARILDINNDNILLTLKQALVDSDLCLIKTEDAIKNKQFPGVVIKIYESGVLIAFYGNMKGFLKKQFIPEANDRLTYLFYRGQVIMTTVVLNDENGVVLSLLPPKPKKENSLQLGTVTEGVIKTINNDGFEVEVNEDICFIPFNHLGSRYLNTLLPDTYKIGEIINDLICIGNRNGQPILSITEYKKQLFKVVDFKDLKVKSLIRCYYLCKSQKGIIVFCPILHFKNRIEILNENLTNQLKKNESVKFTPYQALTAKVLNVDYKNKQLTLSTKLSEVFDCKYKKSVDLFKQYIEDFERIKMQSCMKGNPIGKLELGERVKCVVKKTGPGGGCLVSLENDVRGLVDIHHCPVNITPGDTVEGVIMWIDFIDNYVEISLNSHVISKINEVQNGKIEKTLEKPMTSANLLLIRDNYILGVLNSSFNNQLVILPVYVHDNDHFGLKSYYATNYKIFKKIKLLITNMNDTVIIGFDKKLYNEFKKHNKKSSRKRKLKSIKTKSNKKIKLTNTVQKQDAQNGDEYSMEIKIEDDSDMDNVDVNLSSDESESEEMLKSDNKLFENNDEVNSENSVEIMDSQETENNNFETDEFQESDAEDVNNENNDTEEEESSDQEIFQNGVETKEDDSSSDDNYSVVKIKQFKKGNQTLLSGVNNFYSTEDLNDKKISDSDSSDDENNSKVLNVKKKTKKLSAAERTELLRQDEEKLLKREKELADVNTIPQTAEEFERLLLGKPNSSKLWAMYIAFHLGAAEIEKARRVARKSLDTIALTEVNEKFNIWITLLNLENMYGTKETFENVFNEAIQFNDSLSMYIHVIKMLADMNKQVDMDEKIKKMYTKYKDNYKMWVEVMKIYYECNRITEARRFKDKGLKYITNKKKQIDLIVQSAIFEFKFVKEDHQGEAIFESIIQSHPQRLDVWSTYVDQLIKKNKIDCARGVWERAVCQKLSHMKMKMLYKKFLNFEQTYGDENTVQNVKELAKNYVSSF